ncbi:alpha-L-rhamnosidase [Mumia flava]|uniref:alpha-L-rhamnosidase n=1 Tax=Mumia flava TaxID=1348852 RepID=A0A2M9BGV0_9ACTN|nr:family 78 glycoside hydrolase catalytic domain [Mumia flava]PJJ57185.1 alpha-L-rhamnosidase [Mumia flava]
MLSIRPRRRRRTAAIVASSALLAGALLIPSAPAVGDPSPNAAEAATARPTGLTIGQLPAPADVGDLDAPLLGWHVGTAVQSGYRVQVAPEGDDPWDDRIWDSGRVDSPSSTNVAYDGPRLDPTTAYTWRVRTWNGRGKPSPWSKPADFSTAPDQQWGDSTPIWLGGEDDDAWGDYTLETTFSITTQNATILFRAQDTNNYYMWQVRGDGVNQLAPHKRVNGAYTELKTVPLDLDLQRNTDHTLKIEAVGDTIRTWIDGTLVDTTTDATFSSGTIGFRTGGSERNSWDDLSVTAPDGTSLYASDFSSTASDFACATTSDGRLVVGTGQNCILSEAWRDYTLETTFSITAQNATILFRAADENNYYMWQVRGDGVNELAPHKRVNGTYSVLKTVPLGIDLQRDTDYRLKIEAVGSTIRTWIDGTLVDTTTDSTFDAGTIGFRTGRTEQTTFDDLTVTGAGGSTLYANTFDAPSADFACARTTGGRLAVDVNAQCLLGEVTTDWAFLRGETELGDAPIEKAVVYATGASAEPASQYVYKLWLNGQVVGFGPTRSIANETRFDGYDVTDLVEAGQANALGALAYTTADQRFQAWLVVDHTDGTRETFGTGPEWTTMNGSVVFPQAGSIGTGFYAAPKENLQAEAYPSGFAEPGFDDSVWEHAAAKPAFDDLEATPTAKVEQELKTPVEVVEKSPGHYFLDYGKTWIGGLSLDLDGEDGQVLDLRFGEELSSPQTVRYAMRTGNTYQDLWTLRDGEQHLETWGMRVFRYVEVIGAPTGLGADDFPALAQLYPYDPDGAVFDSSDDALNQVWELSRHTVEATNHNLYVDSWTRERKAYEADSYLQMMANFFTSSDPTLGNYSLDYLLTRRTWPTEWPMYTILAFHDSYLQTGDTAGLERNYDQLVDKLPDQWIEQSTGLIRKNSGSNGGNSCTDCDIVDWPTSERDGYVFRPYNTVINAIGYRSYRDMADIATALGKDADAASFTATADRLREAANERLFDTEKGAYRDGLNADGTPVDHFAVQASVFAAAFGLPDADQASASADYVQSRGMACSVYCAAFVIESLYAGDRGDGAHDLLTDTGLRSWMNMIAKGAGATAEAWDTSLKSNMTWSHPWAASPAYTVPQGMFGIEPTTPGYATYDVRPQPGGVDWAHVTLPTLKGRIGAAYDVVDGRTDVGVSVPGNTTARVFVPTSEEGDATVYVDGVARPGTYERGFLRVDEVGAGCHVLSTSPNASVGDRLTSVCAD